MKSNTLKNIVKGKIIIAIIICLGFTNNAIASCNINGPNSISQGQTATYTSSVVAQAYYWTVSGGLSIIGSRTGNSVQVQCNGTGGTLNLTTFKNGICTSCTPKIITCDPCDHSANFWMSSQHTGLHFNFILTTTVAGDPYSSINWTTSYPLQMAQTGIPSTAQFTGVPSMPRYETVTALFTFPDGCTKSVIRSVYFELFGGGFGGGFKSKKGRVKIFPNPTNSELNIKNENNNLFESIEIRNISNGKIVKRTNVNSKKSNIKLDIKGLKQGHYVLTVLDKKGNVIFKDHLLIND